MIEQKMKLPYLTVLFLLLLMCLVKPVWANGDNVNLADLPQQLAIRLGIDLFPAELLTAAILLSLFLLPTLVLTKNRIAHLIVGLSVLAFVVAMTWWPVWLLVILALAIAVFFSDKITGVFGGRRA